MPHNKQAAKRLRQSKKRHIWNKARLSGMNNQIKKTLGAIGANDVAAAKVEIRVAMKKIDKAAKHRTIHPNTAARRKSLLSRRLAALEATK